MVLLCFMESLTPTPSPARHYPGAKDAALTTYAHAIRHKVRANSHNEKNPSWEPCTLQTIFSMTGERRYFRVAHATADSENNVEGGNNSEIRGDDEERAQQASQFLEQLRIKRDKHHAIAKAAQNMNPDPTEKGAGVELWMKKLGIDRYVAGIYKDEMATSYKPSESEDCAGLRDLREVSNRLLRETWQWCQYGPQQRLTDPQAARISSFWLAADPEDKSKNFRRAVQPETLDIYLSHWAQMLTFCWNGWEGKLFPQTLAALAAAESQNDRQAARDPRQESNAGKERESDIYSGPSSSDDEWSSRTRTSRYLNHTKR